MKLMSPDSMTILQEGAQQDLQQVNDYFKDLRMGHSQYQIDHFILSDEKFPTPAAKYYQCMLEAWVRYETLMTQMFELKKIELEIKGIMIDCEEIEEGISQSHLRNRQMRRLEVQRDMMRNEISAREVRITTLRKGAEETYRELNIFVTRANDNKNAAEDETGGTLPSFEEKEAERWRSHT